jgi:hypothetical protein
MKKLVLLIGAVFFLCLGSIAQSASTQVKEKVDGPVLTFEKNTHDFGDINHGDKVEQMFKFTNTGTEPLIITNIQVTCGCTAPEWPREPIMPGGTGKIKVVFNSTGKHGRQDKTVTVVSNAANDDNKIRFTTNVLSKDPN